MPSKARFRTRLSIEKRQETLPQYRGPPAAQIPHYAQSAEPNESTTLWEFAVFAANTLPPSTGTQVFSSRLVETLYAVTRWLFVPCARPCVRTPTIGIAEPTSICHHSPFLEYLALHACAESSRPWPCALPILSPLCTLDALHTA